MRHSAAPLFSGGLVNEGGGRVQGGRATGPARLSLPRAGGPRGSRASRRLVPQGRAALLTRGSTGPYQRPPPTRLRFAPTRNPLATGPVATTARIHRFLFGQENRLEGFLQLLRILC